MLFLGHIGITAGIFKACDVVMSMAKSGDGYRPDSGSKHGAAIGGLSLYRSLNRIKAKIGSIDYRLVFPASLLPDIIDKPLWFFVGGATFPSGRAYAHTLLFSLALFIGGVVLLRYRKSWLLVISLSSLAHLIFDQMWNNLVTLLWPLLGPLPKKETAGWLSNIFQRLFSSPEVYVPEIIGLVIVLLFAYRLVVKKSVINFFKDGTTG